MCRSVCILHRQCGFLRLLWYIIKAYVSIWKKTINFPPNARKSYFRSFFFFFHQNFNKHTRHQCGFLRLRTAFISQKNLSKIRGRDFSEKAFDVQISTGILIKKKNVHIPHLAHCHFSICVKQIVQLKNV